jgi:predicted nucleic acid-binding protein
MVVSNTTVILYFAKIARPDLLRNCFSRIIIPPEVYGELMAGEDQFQQEMRLIRDLRDEGYLHLQKGKRKRDFGLDQGENSALSLGSELQEKLFLSDDKGARKVARILGMSVLGTVGILLLNLKKGKLRKEEVLSILEELIKKGYYLSTELYGELVRRLQ